MDDRSIAGGATKQRIGIVGAGAIGGFLAAVLARAGHEVGVVARGTHLAAIRQDGIRLVSDAGWPSFTARVNATDDVALLGRQDILFVTLKAHDVPNIARGIARVVDDDTIVIPALNGLPWWYFHGLPPSARNAPLACLDPAGEAAQHIPMASVMGCVVRIAAEVPAPGLVKHTAGRRFIFGEPNNQLTGRLQVLCGTLQAAGLAAEATTSIRAEIWSKLIGNASTNPLSALTHGGLDDLCASPALVDVMRLLMIECREVGARYGISFASDIDSDIERSRSLGRLKPSMLQDVEKGRRMEIPAILDSVSELARRVDVRTPTLDTVIALISERARHP